jgi:hypothetical protein
MRASLILNEDIWEKSHVPTEISFNENGYGFNPLRVPYVESPSSRRKFACSKFHFLITIRDGKDPEDIFLSIYGIMDVRFLPSRHLPACSPNIHSLDSERLILFG